MQLPFFKKRARAGDPIDVQAKPVAATAVSVKAITTIQPDLGDYGRQFDEPLPAQMRNLPVFTCVALLAMAGWGLYDYQQSLTTAAQRKLADRNFNAATAESTRLKAESDGLDGKKKDLQVLTRWVTFRRPVRGMITSIAISAAKNVQIRNLEMKRRDPNILRFNLQINCAGTRSGFDAMRQDLLARLDKEGWSVTEAPADPDDTRLIFDATVSPKAN